MSNECPQCGYGSPTISLAAGVRPPSNGVLALLHTNTPPSPTIAESCRNTLLQLDAAVSQLDSQIARLNDALRLLHEERLRLSDYVQTCRRVLHPVRRLPSAVLGEIFFACVGDPLDLGQFTTWTRPCHSDSLDKCKPWWCLGQVSQLWREVAHSHSKIWSYVAVDLPNPGSFLPDVMVSRLILQLQRSRSHPLTLVLRSTSTRARRDYHCILTALCAHSARWERIRLEFGANSVEMLKAMSRLVRGNLLALSRLYLDLSESSIDTNSGSLDVFALAPRLSVVTLLGGAPAASITDVLHLPYAQITQYSYCCTSASREAISNYEFITRMPNIEILVDQRIFGDELSGRGIIKISSLRVLSFFVYPQSQLSTYGSLLERLQVDHLHDFRTVFCSGEFLPRFLRRTASTLRSLSIECTDTAPITRLLECASGELHTLSLCGVTPESLVALSHLDPKTQQPKVLPELHTLRLYQPLTVDNSDATWQDSGLIDLIESRVPHIATATATSSHLRVIELDTDFQIGDVTSEVLTTCRSRGLEVLRLPFTRFFMPDS